MIPLILVASDIKKTATFIKDFIKKNNVAAHNVFNILPKNKELSISQIREIKKNVIFAFSDLQLIILHDFDKASYEAQNAFLKTLEEHHPLIQFVLVVRSYHTLAPTVVSRSKVVYASAKPPLLPEKEIVAELAKFIKSGSLKILASKQFQTKEEANPIDLFDKIIYFFQTKLINDYKASLIIREMLRTRAWVLNNNLDPQWGIDHILIFIKKTYSSSS